MSEIPVVNIAGKDYPVPPLVLRQMKFVHPALIRFLIRILEIQKDPLKMTPEFYDDMFIIINWGILEPAIKDGAVRVDILQNSPDITFNKLRDMCYVVAKQSGLYIPLPENSAPSEGAPLGEA